MKCFKCGRYIGDDKIPYKVYSTYMDGDGIVTTKNGLLDNIETFDENSVEIKEDKEDKHICPSCYLVTFSKYSSQAVYCTDSKGMNS